jgi:hypothetical protein
MKTLWCKNQENPSDRISHTWAPLSKWRKVGRSSYELGGKPNTYRVSNLMGMKRRMLDIDKKLVLLFAKKFKMFGFYTFCIQSLQKVLL